MPAYARIYEGTNEICRLLTVDMLLKRAMKGRLDIVSPAWAVQQELASMPGFDKPEGNYAEEKKALKDFKKILLMVAGAAAKMQMDGKLNLKHEQEILMNIANIINDIFLIESTLLRVEKLAGMEKDIDQEIYDEMLQVLVSDSSTRIFKEAKDAIASFAKGDLMNVMLMGLKRFNKYPPKNVKASRRKIASALIEKNEYCF